MGKQQQQISYATNKKNLQKSKIVFVGDQYVGKTSVITRFIKDTFDVERNPTIGIDFVSKNVTLGTKMIRLQLWDTAGQERFRSLIPNYIKDCQVALIIFDLTNEESFENLPRWIDFVKEHRGDEVILVVVGNKADLTAERVKCKQLGVKYFEASAKSGEGIERMFQEICAQLLHISSETTIPPLQIMQSKLVSNVPLEKEKPKAAQAPTPAPTKLTKNAVENQRRVKQKDCC